LAKANIDSVKDYQKTEKGKETVKKAQREYQKKNFKLLTTRVRKSTAEVFDRYCDRCQASKNTVLGNYVDKCVEEQLSFEKS
jgi:hypothetical protein